MLIAGSIVNSMVWDRRKWYFLGLQIMLSGRTSSGADKTVWQRMIYYPVTVLVRAKVKFIHEIDFSTHFHIAKKHNPIIIQNRVWLAVPWPWAETDQSPPFVRISLHIVEIPTSTLFRVSPELLSARCAGIPNQAINSGPNPVPVGPTGPHLANYPTTRSSGCGDISFR